MKLETWAPSFLRRIADIWNSEHAQQQEPPVTYVYGVQGFDRVIEVKTKRPIPNARLLRVEDE